jgi:hypothetical protein
MRVTRLEARCDCTSFEDLEFSVHEVAVLDDGSEVVLSELGWTSMPQGVTAAELWDWFTVASITQDVLNAVLPDDDEPVEDHPYDVLAEELDGVTGDDLRSVPYEVVLSPRLRKRLTSARR